MTQDNGFRPTMTQEINGKRTNSTFIAKGTKERAYLIVTGEVSTNRTPQCIPSTYKSVRT